MENTIIIQRDTISMVRAGGYGQYSITFLAQENGEDAEFRSIHSTDSQTFDWYNDDSNIKKHKEANESLVRAITRHYENDLTVIFE